MRLKEFQSQGVFRHNLTILTFVNNYTPAASAACVLSGKEERFSVKGTTRPQGEENRLLEVFFVYR